jgi:hypothetical protein
MPPPKANDAPQNKAKTNILKLTDKMKNFRFLKSGISLGWYYGKTNCAFSLLNSVHPEHL